MFSKRNVSHTSNLRADKDSRENESILSATAKAGTTSMTGTGCPEVKELWISEFGVINRP